MLGIGDVMNKGHYAQNRLSLVFMANVRDITYDRGCLGQGHCNIEKDILNRNKTHCAGTFSVAKGRPVKGLYKQCFFSGIIYCSRH